MESGNFDPPRYGKGGKYFTRTAPAKQIDQLNDCVHFGKIRVITNLIFETLRFREEKGKKERR